MAGLSVERVVRYFPVPVGLTSATAADDDAPVPETGGTKTTEHSQTPECLKDAAPL